jgi:hypothetical protein
MMYGRVIALTMLSWLYGNLIPNSPALYIESIDSSYS